MASVTLPTTTTRATSQSSRRRRLPADPWARWAVRLALAAPLIALGIWANQRGFVSTSHASFLRQAGLVIEGGSDLHGFAYAYPPVPVLLAGLLPGGAIALSIVAALFASIILHLTAEQLLRRGFGWPVAAGMILPVFAVPAVAFAASQAVAGIAVLSLLAVALQGFVWFVADGDTDAGFTCGLALAAAFFFDPISVFYAVSLGVSACFAVERFRSARAATRATVAVIFFPAAFITLAWMFLTWRFTGQAVQLLASQPDLFTFPLGPLGGLGAAGSTVGLALLHVPLFLAVAVLYTVRFPAALIGYVVPVLVSVLAVWVGLRYTAVTAYVLFTLIALMSLPRDTSRTTSRVLAVVGVVQLVLAWVWPPTSPGFEQWLAAILG